MMLNRNLRIKLISFPDTEEMLFSLNNAVVYEILKEYAIDFNITRSNGTEPDTCNVTIWNLEAPEIFSGENSRLELYAGYGDEESLLYRGDITGMRRTKQGADRGIYITCGDGVNAGKAPVNKSYDKNVDYKKVVDDIIDSFTRSGGEIVAGIKDQLYDVFRGKKTASALTLDNAKKSMVDILSKTDKIPLIQNNELQLLDKVTKAIDTYTIIIDNSSGLVGVPERGFAMEDKEEKVVENGKTITRTRRVKIETLNFSCLILPDVIVGRRVRVGDYGDWVVSAVSVQGSTRSNNWIMNCEAR